MIGPHYEKLAEIEQRMTAKQMLEKIRHRPDNPLSRVIDKLKKQFSEYETAYSDPMMDYQISSLDRILSFDSKLGPILDGLQKENLLLRKQLSVLESQLSNTVGICEQILAENGELKLIVRRKNDDIAKIIETIANNQSQEMSDLQQKNNLLIRQNSILMTHLQEIRKQHQKYGAMFRDNQDERDNLERKVGQMKKQMAQSMTRQRQLSRKISLLEQSSYQNNQQLYQLRHKKENLVFQNNQLKNQVVLLQGKGDGSSHQTIKRQLENQYEPIVEEHRLLKKERTQLLRQAEKLKLQKEKLEDVQSQLERETNKASGDLQLTTSLLQQQKIKYAALSNNLAKMESKLADLKQQNNKLRAQKQSSSSYALTRQKRLLQQIDELRRSVDDKNGEVESRIREISRSMQGLLESKEGELKHLREENLRLQRLLQHR